MDYAEKLLGLIEKAVEESCLGSYNIGVPFSGGVDSSVIATLASKRTDLTLYSVGVSNSYDLRIARATAEILDLPLVEIVIDLADVKEALPKVVRIMQTTHPVKVSFELPLYFVARQAQERVLVSGQGADELFGGYARYASMENSRMIKSMKEDIELLIQSGVHLDRKIVACHNKELRCPYLHKAVVEFALDLPIEKKVWRGSRKIILREVARKLGLPESIANRPKKAVQYGSGIISVMRRIAKGQGSTVTEYLNSISFR